MKIIVYRDENGNVINIGEWDYMISIDENNNEIINNPVPENSTNSIESIIVNDDGSRAVV